MADSLSTNRLEAFSDGVIAVIITIMVLEMKVPTLHDIGDRTALVENLRIGAVYLLSYVQVGIYWVNHHYLLDDLETVSHGILWSNLVVLFTMSFIPFGLEWVATRGIRPLPVALYAFCFLLPALSWTLLARSIQRRTGIPPAAGRRQQLISVTLTLAAIPLAFLSPWLALALVGVVALMWLIPPARVIEKSRALQAQHTASPRSS